MKAYSRIVLILALTIFIAGIAPALFPAQVEARDPVASVVVADDDKVGGEPGEDPHLKVNPIRMIESDSDALGCGSFGDTRDADVNGTQAAGIGEERGGSFGSRVSCWWRMLLRTWLRQMQR
jgi:hypothetical protein